MSVNPKLETLVGKAVAEVGPVFASIGRELVAGAIGNIIRAETLFEKRVAGNDEMRAFVGKDRDKVYATLLTSYGVSEGTAKDILSFVMSP